MRKAMLADNLIKRYTLFKRALPAICLGLLPSQVFATTQTCEAYPNCATLGYTQTSCDDYSISLKCPFDDSKLFCSGCDRTYTIKDPVNNVCVDGKTYCANQNGGEEFDRGECVGCDGSDTFVESQMKCVNKCVAAGYEKAVPSNNICTKIQHSGVTCYTGCKPVSTSNCGTSYTGYVNGSTVISSVNNRTIGIVRDDGYYMPYKLKTGNFTYSAASGEASSAGGVLPEAEETSYINQIDSSLASLTYWTSTSEDCDTYPISYVLYSTGCQIATANAATSIVLLKKCASK